MDSKIQVLTDKIYLEGVEKGNAEAQRIVAEAEATRAELVKKAQAEAEQIVREAQKRAAELEKNTKSELKLYAGQTLESLKSTIVDQISGRIVSSNVKAALVDAGFMQKFILELAKNWTPGEQIVIKTSDAESLMNYFESNAKEMLDKTVTIELLEGVATSFTISPKDGSYKIEFGEEQFASLFKSFLRPRLVEMLF